MERSGLRGLASDDEGARRGAHEVAGREQRFAATSGTDAGSSRRAPSLRAESLLRAAGLGPRGASILPRTPHLVSGFLAAYGESGSAAASSSDWPCSELERDGGPG